MSMDPYRVLGVRRSASDREVRRAFVEQARRHHPDHGGDPERMQEVTAAWAILGDPERRRAWDRENSRHAGRHGEGAWPHEPAPPDDDGNPHVDLDLDLDLDLLDPRSLAPPVRSPVDFLPVALFAAAVLSGCLALALDVPGLLAAAAFLFFLSCLAVVAAAMLAMRRSVRAGRR